MARREARWLLSVIMSVVMIVTTLASPVTVMAAGEDGQAGSTVKYVNSDGEEIELSEKDGFYFDEVNSDGEDVIKIYGYKGTATDLKVPEKIDELPVVSFAIDPRWPVTDEEPYDERYDTIKSIELPATIECAHSNFLNYFTGLESVSMKETNEYYKSENGVLYKFNDTGCQVAAYPRAKKDTTYVMPQDVNKMYGFFEGCPLQSITLSKNIDYVSYRNFRNLDDLKEIKVQDGNEKFFARNGVLFKNDYDWDEVYNEEEDEYDEVRVDFKALCKYPAAKEGATYTVPEDITVIFDEAFFNVQNLNKLVLSPEMSEIYYGAFDDADSLKEIEFTANKAPDPKNYYDFGGVRDLLDYYDDANVTYPETGTGYEDFVKWLNGKERNYWEETPYMPYDEIPLGANIYLEGEAESGTVHYVYSDKEAGPYTDTVPTKVGTYYAKGIVDETDEYFGLESDPIEFTIVNPDPDQELNWWIREPGDVWATYGTEIMINAVPLIGTPEFRYISAGDYGDDSKWTTTKPTKPGIYYYEAKVPETEAYEGLLFISHDEDVYIEIEKREYDIRVTCDDILPGGTPQPKAEFYEDEEYDDVDLSKVEFKFYKITYDDDDDEVETLVTSFTEPGEYYVEGKYETENFIASGGRRFYVLTKAKQAENLIEDLPSPKNLDILDENYVAEAKAAFDALTAEDKAELGEERVAELKEEIDKAAARMETLKAELNRMHAEDAYSEAEDTLAEKKAAYDAAKAAYDEAAAKKAKDTQAKAEAYVEASKAYEEAAKAAETAAEDLKKALQDEYAAAKNDPVMSRGQKQNAYRNVESADQAITDAQDAATTAANAKKDSDAVAQSDEKYKAAVKKAKALKVTKVKAKALKKRKATVTWKPIKKIYGYKVQYSLKKTYKKAKTVNIKKAKIKKATLKKLKARKKYYIRVCAVTKVKNPFTGKTETIQGKWVKVKKPIKAKK